MQVAHITIARLIDADAAAKIEQAASHIGMTSVYAANGAVDAQALADELDRMDGLVDQPNEFGAMFGLDTAESRCEQHVHIGRAIALVRQIAAM